ncbi:FKBP-type peptidyl-prolyl cis-trans isomerase [Pedobacter endophyticus]|uniref:Peptidyl-prolyl cis-trans isomerase n=1 Tax=Pedobacter endophyticus TaxID=2789740 RepID=A0A7U3SPF7_9SPHI|nr:FKBP-type peptidyl-prolyl cis-trans isomerase [Pedobacter endophyticus]QPH38568.1 FKBP-type peptidyl-prolyl cis-trans isomerase [Pedobacter endophyticus]
MNNFTKLSLFTVLATTTIFSSCKKEYESIQRVDDAAIKSYIAKNNLTSMQQDPDKTGFYFQVTNPTTGDLFLNKDSVLYDVVIKSMQSGNQYLKSPVNGNLGTYVGYLNNFFQSSLSTSTTYNIPALRTATLALKPGGVARILLPSYLAFGRNGAGGIPSNENLDVTITTYPYKKQWQFDDVKIQNFLTAKGLTATKDASRVYYITTAAGTGTETITETSTVVYKYTGRLLDGTVFDSSTDGTYSTTLQYLIQGWKAIIPKFTAGAKIRMFIPSDMGYGLSGNGAIPPNAVLDFDIEIVSVTK